MNLELRLRKNHSQTDLNHKEEIWILGDTKYPSNDWTLARMNGLEICFISYSIFGSEFLEKHQFFEVVIDYQVLVLICPPTYIPR